MADELRLDGQAVIVTGGARGLGLAYARLLAARGALLVINDLGVERDGTGGSAAPAGAAAEEIRRAGGQAVADASDVASREGAQGLVDACMRAWGRVDAVINNAGNFLGLRPFEQTTIEDFASVWRVHLGGTYHVCQAVLPHFKRAGAGRLVNSCSIQGMYGAATSADYAAAKGAVIGLTFSLAAATRGSAIRVNAISPGGFTRMVSGDARSPEVIRLVEAGMDSALAAPAAVWLCHPACHSHGEIIEAFGGRFSRAVIGTWPGFWDFDPTPESVARGFAAMTEASPLWQAPDSSSMAQRVLAEAAARRAPH
jgi:3-hydroxyacyl-CoA dehydrogenase/3a,7a,12a-trihydroxy-5b-cholest-24-enoyl-CoA hydratase